MCHDIQIFSPDAGQLTDTDDENFVPGETLVYFVCAGEPNNSALPEGYYYNFRVYEPCGSPNHTTPISFTSDDSNMPYQIEYSGEHVAQCAVCGTESTPAGPVEFCDWEAYTPSVCE
jgi:hypothetical protein